MANIKRAAQLVADMQFQQTQSEAEIAILSSQMEGDMNSDLSAGDQALVSRSKISSKTPRTCSSMQDALDMGPSRLKSSSIRYLSEVRSIL